MNVHKKNIQQVPTNIISGFLGTGKTTAIINLFKQKPATETWAVLVNEFGQRGIDEKIYASQNIHVTQLPGGCMCCAQGLPLQVTVNRLLAASRPDRLLIETSGVGHPAGVLKTLTDPVFQDVLSMRATICLINPQHLLDERYLQNERFQEQCQFADILAANKTDLCDTAALDAFRKLTGFFQPDKDDYAEVVDGNLPIHYLDACHQHQRALQHRDALQQFAGQHTAMIASSTAQSPWQSATFEHSEQSLFDIDKLRTHLLGHPTCRIKGRVQTASGTCLINYADGQLNVTNICDEGDFYIEVIDQPASLQTIERILTASLQFHTETE